MVFGQTDGQDAVWPGEELQCATGVAIIEQRLGVSVAKQADGVSDAQKKRFEIMHRRIVESRQHSTMMRGLVHKTDYFFLGPSAWMLVREKFDFDGYELSRACVRTGGSQNTLAIQLREEESEGNIASLIQIPASGRFPYEKDVLKGDLSPSKSESAVVPEEEDGNTEVSLTGRNGL